MTMRPVPDTSIESRLFLPRNPWVSILRLMGVVKPEVSSAAATLTPFDSVDINRLQEAFEMPGTHACDMQAILYAILNGT